MYWILFIGLYCLSQYSSAFGHFIEGSVDPWNFIASVAQYPSELHRCAASFITNRHLLTTARCVYCLNERCNFFVHSLPPTLRSWTTSDHRKIYDVVEVKIHPEYDRYPQKYDVGIIKIHNEASHVKPLLLPKQVDTYREKEASIYKWNFSPDRINFYLSQLKATTISNAMCSLIFNTYIDCQHVCVKRPKVFSFGSYDQGTPLVVKNKSKAYIYGLYSREGTKQNVTAEIFELVVPFVPWINLQIEGSSNKTDESSESIKPEEEFNFIPSQPMIEFIPKIRKAPKNLGKTVFGIPHRPTQPPTDPTESWFRPFKP